MIDNPALGCAGQKRSHFLLGARMDPYAIALMILGSINLIVLISVWLSHSIVPGCKYINMAGEQFECQWVFLFWCCMSQQRSNPNTQGSWDRTLTHYWTPSIWKAKRSYRPVQIVEWNKELHRAGKD